MAKEPVSPVNLSAAQQRYFAAIRESMKRETGRTLAQWVKIAKTCPETKRRARLLWFKNTHGLLQNRASMVLAEAFKSEEPGWDQPEALIDALWTDETARLIYARVDAAAMKLGGAVRTARKGYTAWARKYQFAAARPAKGGVRLGLAVSPETGKRLAPAKANDGWSERLKSVATLAKPGDVDAALKSLLKQAWAAS